MTEQAHALRTSPTQRDTSQSRLNVQAPLVAHTGAGEGGGGAWGRGGCQPARAAAWSITFRRHAIHHPLNDLPVEVGGGYDVHIT